MTRRMEEILYNGFGALAEEAGTPIYAWALMSNHVHILLCSGALGLAKFMRRLLTGYAVGLQPAASPAWACFSEPLQIDCLRRRQLFHRTRPLHSLESVEGRAGQGFEGTGKVSVLRAWGGPGNAGKAVARLLQECAGAVWQASCRCEGGVPEICCRGSQLGRRPELVGGGLAQ